MIQKEATTFFNGGWELYIKNGVRNVWGEKNLNSASPVVDHSKKQGTFPQVEYVFQGLGFFFIFQNWEFYYFDSRPASLAGRRKPHVTFQSLVLSPSNASTKCWRWLWGCSSKFCGRKWGPWWTWTICSTALVIWNRPHWWEQIQVQSHWLDKWSQHKNPQQGRKNEFKSSWSGALNPSTYKLKVTIHSNSLGWGRSKPILGKY